MAGGFVDRWWAWVVPLSWQLILFVALVAILALCVRRASPQVRYLLWCFVLVKIFLPPSLAVEWGVGSWGLLPAWQSIQASATVDKTGNEPGIERVALADGDTTTPSATAWLRDPRTILFIVWLVGCAGMLAASIWQYRRLSQAASAMLSLDEGPLQFDYEALALKIAAGRSPELFISSEITSPFLFGLWQPKIVLPSSLVEVLSRDEMKNVLAHELSHWRRRDLWIGWVQVLAQSLMWFHPLVWWANARMRHERECACDEDVLRMSESEPAAYGETLLRVLSAAKGRAEFQGNLVGVFEPGANIQQRLEQIMNYKHVAHRLRVVWYPALLILMLVLLPMTPVSTAKGKVATADAKRAEKMPAWIVATEPAIGAIDVDPDLKEISVTFDRDMSGGMSWTGAPPLHPGDPDRKAEWRDNRTCIMPVKLKEGEFYRVGINSTSFLNFRSEQGVPAPCTAIYFVTRGATKAIQSRVRVPEIAKMIPKNGADDVDPNTKVLRVTFNVPMGEGMSWTGGGENFPEAVNGERPKWSADGKTCMLARGNAAGS